MPILRRKNSLQTTKFCHESTCTMNITATITVDDQKANTVLQTEFKALVQERFSIAMDENNTITITAKDAISFKAAASGLANALASYEKMTQVK